VEYLPFIQIMLTNFTKHWWTCCRRSREYRSNRMAIHLLDPSSTARLHCTRPLDLILAEETYRLPKNDVQAGSMGLRPYRLLPHHRCCDIAVALAQLGWRRLQVERATRLRQSCGRSRVSHCLWSLRVEGSIGWYHCTRLLL
jgi:hypothetical protein